MAAPSLRLGTNVDDAWWIGLARPALAGLGGSIAVAVGGALAGAGRPAQGTSTWFWDVPSIPVEPVVDLLPALVLFYGGLVVLSRAWLHLRHAVAALDGPERRRRQAALLVCALWALPLVVGPPLASRDVYAYAAVGELVQAGFDPYQVGPAALEGSTEGEAGTVAAVDPRWREQPTPYGPGFVAVAGAASGIARTPVGTVLLLRVAALAGLALVAAFLPRLASHAGRDGAVALVLALANPLTLLHLVSGAHNEALLAGLVVAGVAVATTRTSEVPSGLALGLRRPAGLDAATSRTAYVTGLVLCTLAVGIKVPAALAVVWLAWNRPGPAASIGQRMRSVLAAAAVALATLATLSEVLGAGWGWTETLGAAGEVTAYLAPTTWLGGLMTLVGTWSGLDAIGAAGPHLAVLGLGLAALLAATLVARSHRVGSWTLGAALLGVALLLPAVHPWYLVWGLILLAAVADRSRTFLVLSVVATFVVLPGGPDLGTQLLAERSVWVLALTILAMTPLLLPWGRRRRTPGPAAAEAA